MSPDRTSSRVIGIVLAVLAIVFFEEPIWSLTLFVIAMIIPILFLPISLILRKVGSGVAKVIVNPLLVLLYSCLIVPYGLVYQLFARSNTVKFRDSSDDKIVFEEAA